MEKPEVSLIICTRDRAEKLGSCLEYIARQNPSCAWELVVVDNGSTDGTSEVLKKYAKNVPFPTKLLYQPAPGKSRGLNQALQAADGEIIALTDDDCYVAADYIDRVRETFSDPKIGFAGGRVDLFDPTDIPMTIRTSEQRELFKPQSFIEAGTLFGANMMFRRQVLQDIGGFDLGLGPGNPVYGGEDSDVLTRASLAGWWGLYTPEVILAHHHGRKAKNASTLQRTYSIGNGAFMAKFLFISETRPIVLRHLYWKARKAVRRSAERRCLMWEIQGLAGYLAYRLRKRITGG